jgi:hypothetical protein
MESELAYLKRRADFHRRMAREAASSVARCAHEGFVHRYAARIIGLNAPKPVPAGMAHAATSN